MAKTFIVVPTYNEKENIEKLLAAIFALTIPDLYVLVVDDNSPDGTGRVVEQLRSANPRLSVLHRPGKGGLGPAYLAGFTEAVQHGAELLFEMDADFSHDPAHLPAFLTAIQNADVVLGSRYCAGGGVANWNVARRLISRFGNQYARMVLGMPYHDLTGGFKCYRRAVVELLLKTPLSSLGYNFQIETTYRAHLAGFKIVEIPITFTERREGKSKFNAKIMIEGFFKVALLRFKKTK